MSDTQPAPLTEQQLDAIAARAGHLYEYVTVDDGDAQTALDRLAGTDTPALLAEVRRQRAELAEMRATIERLRTAYRCQPHEAAPETETPRRSRTARFLDALTHSGPGYDLTPTETPEAEAPVVCEGFVWIGQSFATCDRCAQPAWDHEEAV